MKHKTFLAGLILAGTVSLSGSAFAEVNASSKVKTSDVMISIGDIHIALPSDRKTPPPPPPPPPHHKPPHKHVPPPPPPHHKPPHKHVPPPPPPPPKDYDRRPHHHDGPKGHPHDYRPAPNMHMPPPNHKHDVPPPPPPPKHKEHGRPKG